MIITGIYQIYCYATGKSYVGQSIDIHKRLRTHSLGNTKDCRALHAAIKKYPREQFRYDVLEVCSEETLHDRECHWIAALDSIAPNGYNIKSGGEGGRQSEETKRRIGNANRGRKLPPLSEKAKQRLRTLNKNRSYTPHTQATRKKISDACKKSFIDNPNRRKKASIAGKKGADARWGKDNPNQLKLF